MANSKATKKFFEVWMKKKALNDKKKNLLLRKSLFEKEKRYKTILKWLKQVL